MLTLESALMDTSYDLELEKIRNKIKRLYKELLVKTYKAANPSASPEDIQNFIDKNELEFKGDGFDEESEDLESLLDLLMQEEDLDEVKNKEYEKHDVQSGNKPPKVSEGRPAPKTHSFKVPKGGLFTPPDKRKKPDIKEAVAKIPKGRIKRIIDDNPKIDTQKLKDIWDRERDKLLALVESRNKEYGVVL